MPDSSSPPLIATAAPELADRIRSAGARATPARIRVLALLTSAPVPLSHHDIEAALGDASLDRVTLYRVLDWLVASGLAVKRADERGRSPIGREHGIPGVTLAGHVVKRSQL